MARSALTTVALFLACPTLARADGGLGAEPLVSPSTLSEAWNFDLLVLLNLSLLGWLYLRGAHALWQKAGPGRGVSYRQAAAFLTSLTVLLVALISPLHALAEVLASAHMVQHMLLMVVAAPLFVVGSPEFVLSWGLAPRWRRVAVRWRRALNTELLSRPLLPWMLYAGDLWIWHLPSAYQAALVDPLVHDVQHLSFFIASCLFWRMLLDPLRRRRLHPLTAVTILFTTSLHAMLLGIFMALSPVVWYEIYSARSMVWGLTPLEDQQLAGLIMWMPACLIYPASAAVAMGTWLTDLGQRSRETSPCGTEVRQA